MHHLGQRPERNTHKFCRKYLGKQYTSWSPAVSAEGENRRRGRGESCEIQHFIYFIRCTSSPFDCQSSLPSLLFLHSTMARDPHAREIDRRRRMCLKKIPWMMQLFKSFDFLESKLEFVLLHRSSPSVSHILSMSHAVGRNRARSRTLRLRLNLIIFRIFILKFVRVCFIVSIIFWIASPINWKPQTIH